MKVTLAVTHKEGFVLSIMAFTDNGYEGPPSLHQNNGVLPARIPVNTRMRKRTLLKVEW